MWMGQTPDHPVHQKMHLKGEVTNAVIRSLTTRTENPADNSCCISSGQVDTTSGCGQEGWQSEPPPALLMNFLKANLGVNGCIIVVLRCICDG